jgi:hypothetical protein
MSRRGVGRRKEGHQTSAPEVGSLSARAGLWHVPCGTFMAKERTGAQARKEPGPARRLQESPRLAGDNSKGKGRGLEGKVRWMRPRLGGDGSKEPRPLLGPRPAYAVASQMNRRMIMTRTTITTTVISSRSTPHLLPAFRRPRKDSVKAGAPEDPSPDGLPSLGRETGGALWHT